jgi:hypothetical protein
MLNCLLRLQWKSAGTLTQDKDGRIRFPKLSAAPGLYQFKIFRSDGTRAVYVGETSDIQRRFAHYRNPGPTQQTNIRLNAMFTELLLQGAKIEIEIVTDGAWTIWNSGNEVKADLSKKAVRRLFENFVLCAEQAVDVENLNR